MPAAFADAPSSLPLHRKVLENAKHLNLNRLQLLSIMSLVDLEPGTTNLMNYRKFSQSAAKMINRLLDVNEQKVRNEVGWERICQLALWVVSR